MKKLVKTAKQQFEERLSELKVFGDEEVAGVLYYECYDNNDYLIILSEHSGETPYYYEVQFGVTYEQLTHSNDFLRAMVDRLADQDQDIKPLFDWYADSDNKTEPFDLCDIDSLSDSMGKTISFEDIYEEVPDVKIVTAKEQWERESVNARLIAQYSNGSIYKAQSTDDSIVFFTYKDGAGYFKEVYPSVDELRKDGKFVTNYISLIREMHDEDLPEALNWLAGSDCTMSDMTLFDIYEAATCKYSELYEDREEQPIEKDDFTQDIHALRDKMVEHIKDLCEQGMTIDMDKLIIHPFLLWDDMSYVRVEDLPDFWLAKNKFGVWMAYRSGDEGWEYELYDFSIESLQHIINCLH